MIYIIFFLFSIFQKADSTPSLHKISPIAAVWQDTGPHYFRITGVRAEPPHFVQAVEAGSDNLTLIETEVTYTPRESTATIAFTPRKNQHGTATIAVVAIDDFFRSAVETVTVTVKPVPIDCKYSEWSEWTNCSAKCGSGQKFRTRLVERLGQNGGRTCHSDDLIEMATCAGRACRAPTLAPIEDREVYTGSEEVQEVILSGISDGSGGNQRVTLSAITNNPKLVTDLQVVYLLQDTSAVLRFSLGPDAADSEAIITVTAVTTSGQSVSRSFRLTVSPMPSAVDCQVQWSEWGPCSAPCGNGNRTRSQVIAVPPSNGGKSCSSLEKQTENCKDLSPCAQNCLLSFGSWGPCTKTCGGGGTQMSRITILSPPINGGTECPSERFRTRECGTNPCPRDCEYEWGEWSSCSKTCGGGSRRRMKLIKAFAVHGGVPCTLEANREVETQDCNTFACQTPHSQIPSLSTLSCKGRCGTVSPSGCGCDDQCANYQDCCSDFDATCRNSASKGSCEGHCNGEGNPPGCWCDSFCRQNGDCCSNHAEVCVIQAFRPAQTLEDTCAAVALPSSVTCARANCEFCSTGRCAVVGYCSGALPPAPISSRPSPIAQPPALRIPPASAPAPAASPSPSPVPAPASMTTCAARCFTDDRLAAFPSVSIPVLFPSVWQPTSIASPTYTASYPLTTNYLASPFTEQSFLFSTTSKPAVAPLYGLRPGPAVTAFHSSSNNLASSPNSQSNQASGPGTSMLFAPSTFNSAPSKTELLPSAWNHLAQTTGTASNNIFFRAATGVDTTFRSGILRSSETGASNATDQTEAPRNTNPRKRRKLSPPEVSLSAIEKVRQDFFKTQSQENRDVNAKHTGSFRSHIDLSRPEAGEIANGVDTNQCNWQCYLARNPDLVAEFGSQDVNRAKLHFIEFGKNEGRQCTCRPCKLEGAESPFQAPRLIPHSVQFPRDEGICTCQDGQWVDCSLSSSSSLSSFTSSTSAQPQGSITKPDIYSQMQPASAFISILAPTPPLKVYSTNINGSDSAVWPSSSMGSLNPSGAVQTSQGQQGDLIGRPTAQKWPSSSAWPSSLSSDVSGVLQASTFSPWNPEPMPAFSLYHQQQTTNLAPQLPNLEWFNLPTSFSAANAIPTAGADNVACFCDLNCAQLNDCCSDFWAVCATVPNLFPTPLRAGLQPNVQADTLPAWQFDVPSGSKCWRRCGAQPPLQVPFRYETFLPDDASAAVGGFRSLSAAAEQNNLDPAPKGEDAKVFPSEVGTKKSYSSRVGSGQSVEELNSSPIGPKEPREIQAEASEQFRSGPTCWCHSSCALEGNCCVDYWVVCR